MPAAPRDRDLPTISAAFFLTFLGTGAAQPFIVGYVQEAKGVSLAESSLVLATVYFSFAVFRFFVGAVVNVTGLHAAKLFGVATYALYPLVILRAEGLPALLAASVLWGLGAPLLWTASLTQVMNRAPASRYGTAAGIVRGCSMTALFLGHYLLSYLYARWGYGPVLGFAACGALAGAAAMALSPRRQIERPRPSLATFARVMRRPETLLLAGLLLFSGLGYGVVLNGFTEHIETLHGADWLAWLLPLFSLTGIACNFGGGRVSDRVGRWPTIAAAYGLGGVGLLGAWAAPHPAATAVAMMCMGVLFGMVPLSAFGWIGDHTTPDDRAAVMGYVFCFRDAGIAAAILARGLVGAFTTVLLAFATISLACALAAGFTASRTRRTAALEPTA